jgi:hypothetical protein
MLGKIKQKIINWCLSLQEIEIGQFHEMNNANNVAISDGSKLKFIEQANINNWYVESEDSYIKIEKSLKTVPYKIYTVLLEDGKYLQCADEHIVIDKNGKELYVKDLKTTDWLKTIDGNRKVQSVTISEQEENMYDLQLKDQHIYYTNGILSHNTTVVAIYVLWLTTFYSDKECKIASKNMGHATDIMSRIKFSYEELPDWLKAGCKFYNRTSIEFDNGSKIKSEATTDKTGRGNSPSLLFIDEVSFINKKIQDLIWASLAPSLSNGGKLVMTTTPNGDSDLFARLWRGAVSGTNSFKHLLVLYDRHPQRGPGSGYYEEMVAELGEVGARIELDCEFYSAEPLLINSLRLGQLRSSTPIYEDHGFKFWDEIKSRQIYFVAVDIATGSGNDFSVIQVFDFPGLNQVAQYRTNTMIIPELYQKIKWILNRLTYGYTNEVFWTFERNSVGEAIASLYHVDENVPESANLVNEGTNKYGMQTINKSKMLACMQLKTLVEKIKNGINIKSDIDIFELKNYISTGASYAAKSGATDDTVAALLLIVRLIKYASEFDENAHKIMYQYDENDYSEDDQYEPLPVLF